MASLLNIKEFVANELGTTDSATSSTKRDNLINRARAKYYSERRWSFCFRSATVTITAQLGTLPTTYNYKFDPKCVYTYTSNIKYEYEKVEWSEISGYSTGSYVYAINKQSGQIKINQTSVSSVSMDYYQLPADASIAGADDANTELAPDISAIGYLSLAYYIRSARQETEEYKAFLQDYKEQLANDILIDSKNQPIKGFNSLRRNVGYNKGTTGQIMSGYIGRR